MTARARINQQLSAYLDGELGEPDLQRVERALEADPALREELAELSATRDLLRALPVERAPQDLAARVMAEAERAKLVGATHTETAPSPLRWIRYMATAAVLLIAAGVGMIIAVTLWSPPEFTTTIARSSPDRSPGPGTGGRMGEPAGGPAAAAPPGKAGGAETYKVAVTDRGGQRGEGLAAGESGAGRLEAPGKAAANDTAALGFDAVTPAKIALSKALAGNEVIYTDRMDDTRREIENLLFVNGCQPAEVRTSLAALKSGKEIAARANFYRQTRAYAGQIQYEAFVTPEQMATVQKHLGTLRSRQAVSQFALAYVPSRAEGGGGPAGGGSALGIEERDVSEGLSPKQKGMAAKRLDELQRVAGRGVGFEEHIAAGQEGEKDTSGARGLDRRTGKPAGTLTAGRPSDPTAGGSASGKAVTKREGKGEKTLKDDRLREMPADSLTMPTKDDADKQRWVRRATKADPSGSTRDQTSRDEDTTVRPARTRPPAPSPAAVPKARPKPAPTAPPAPAVAAKPGSGSSTKDSADAGGQLGGRDVPPKVTVPATTTVKPKPAATPATAPSPKPTAGPEPARPGEAAKQLDEGRSVTGERIAQVGAAVARGRGKAGEKVAAAPRQKSAEVLPVVATGVRTIEDGQKTTAQPATAPAGGSKPVVEVALIDGTGSGRLRRADKKASGERDASLAEQQRRLTVPGAASTKPADQPAVSEVERNGRFAGEAKRHGGYTAATQPSQPALPKLILAGMQPAYGRQGIAATQQATARLWRLVITVNYRSQAEDARNNEILLRLRAHQAAKQAETTDAKSAKK